MHIWLTSLLLFTLAELVFAQETIIRLGTKFDWAPYHISTQFGSDGLAVRSVSCIMARINQPYLINKLPWKRAQYETRKGNLDGFFAASQNQERDEYATLSKLFIPQERIFYSIKRRIKVPLDKYTPSYIRLNVTVAARAGSNALESLKLEKYNVWATPQSQEQLLDMLDSGRVGAILENALVFDELLSKTGRNKGNYHLVVHKTSNMGVYFGNHFLQGNPGFLERFNNNVQPCSLLSERQ